MLATVSSATLVGVDGRPIVVEVHVAQGLPGFNVVGLPDTSCREARDRVRAAVMSSGLHWPQRRITVNLAPTAVRKGGAGLDLPIALAVLAADGQLDAQALDGVAFLGELGLDGALRYVPGTLALVAAMDERVVVVAPAGAPEAALLGRRRVLSAPTLAGVVAALRGEAEWLPGAAGAPAEVEQAGPDLADVRGQALGRVALEVAAAGGHHLLLVGPPGAGKTMLAHRLPGLLPALGEQESLQVTKIHSAAGVALPRGLLVRRPPLRSPHHSASLVSLVGGGTAAMRPGEISCSHHGVLFLDEIAEFDPAVLDALRQPIEEGEVLVCRAKAAVRFPARFLLVAAANPCPCGGDGSPGGCRCSDAVRARYASRISGPLLDRFDLRVNVDRPDVDELLPVPGAPNRGEPTAAVAARVADARRIAERRGVACNGWIPGPALADLAALEPGARRLLETRLRQGRLSARGLHRVRRVARTVADLGGREGPVGEEDVSVALALRADPFALICEPV